MFVIHNTQRPYSNLNNKIHEIFQHAFCDSVAMCWSLTSYIMSGDYVVDFLTKVLYVQKREYLVSQVLCDIYDEEH